MSDRDALIEAMARVTHEVQWPGDDWDTTLTGAAQREYRRAAERALAAAEAAGFRITRSRRRAEIALVAGWTVGALLVGALAPLWFWVRMGRP